MAGCEDECMEGVVHSEGIPCLRSHVGSVIKALQPTLDVLSQNAKRPFNETNSMVSIVQNNVNVLLFLHSVLVLKDLTLVVSSPSPGTSIWFLSCMHGHCFRAGAFWVSP